MSLRRILIVALVVSIVTMWLGAAYWYSLLPDRFPTHFDGAGHPDHFAPKTLGMWFALPVTFSVLTAIFVTMAVFLPSIASRHSRFVNVPDKAKFLTLSQEARQRALEPMRDLSLMMPIPLALLAIYIGWGSTEVALGNASSLSPAPILFVMLSSFVCLGVTITRMQKSIQDEIERR